MASWLRFLPETGLTDVMVSENSWKVTIKIDTLFISRQAVLFPF